MAKDKFQDIELEKKDRWQAWILGATNMPESEVEKLEADLEEVMKKYSQWTQDFTTDSGDL